MLLAGYEHLRTETSVVNLGAYCPNGMTTRSSLVHEFRESMKRRFNNVFTGYDTWTVGTANYVVVSEAWRLEGHCKLCLISTDSYDHIYLKFSHPAIADTLARLLEGILKRNSTLTGNEALLAGALLQLYQEEDEYRKALGDLTLSHRLSL